MVTTTDVVMVVHAEAHVVTLVARVVRFGYRVIWR